MNSKTPIPEVQSRRLLAELDAEAARIDERQAERLEQVRAIAKLKAICEPYMKADPTLTVAEAMDMDRRMRPWAYPRVN